MNNSTERKIVIVKRKTRLEELIVRFNTVAQAKFYIEHMGSDFSDYISEDECYKKVLIKAQSDLDRIGRIVVIDRGFLPNYLFGESDIVIAIGQDGMVANTLKYLNGQPLIGINPDPTRWDGVLLPFTVDDIRIIAQEVIKDKRAVKEVSMAKATLNDGQELYAVNDLFIGQRTHVSSRYQIKLGEKHESQSSSGIIVSTGLGSTGWLKSIISGSNNIMKQLSGVRNEIRIDSQMPWDENKLYFAVREPFPSKISGTEIVFGKITKEVPLRISSQMPENGVIFSDGIESDYLQFNSGIEACITVADKKGLLVV